MFFRLAGRRAPRYPLWMWARTAAWVFGLPETLREICYRRDNVKPVDELQKTIGHRFGDMELLLTAMTHSSWANEQAVPVEHNERLEFLGDAVLELCVSEELFRRFPSAREGDLTRMRSRLVSKPSLEGVARELRLDMSLRLGKGEESQGGRERGSLLSDALEAMLGVVFLDAGYIAAKGVVMRILGPHFPEALVPVRTKDYKSQLQELTQKLFRDRPVYTLLGSSGPEHDKQFDVRVVLPDGTVFEATGPSMKRAEQMAAARAVATLDK